MTVSRTIQRFADVLLRAGLVDDMQLKSALAHCDQWGTRLPKALAELGFADEDEVVETLAQSMRMPILHLGNVLKDNGALKVLGAEFCEKNGVFPVSLKDRQLTLAMADPTELHVIDDAGAKARARVTVVMAAETEITLAIARHYHGRELPPPRRTAPRKADRVSSGISGEMPAYRPPFTPEEVARIQAAAQNQQKVGAILRALQELLAAKGVRR
jgi:hypothetical protein